MEEAKSLAVHRAQSFNTDPRGAVAELSSQLKCSNMAALVFFCSVDYDLVTLGQEIKKEFDCPVIGCTTAGEIGPSGYSDSSIAAFSIQSEKFRVFPHLIADIASSNGETIERLAKQVKQQVSDTRSSLPDASPFGFLVIDGLSAKEELIIGQLYYALSNVPIVGGSAGGGDKFQSTYVYHDGKFIGNAAVFTLFVTSHPFEIFRTQHFVPIDGKLVITKARPEERLVNEINGRPAAQEYARCLGLDTNNLSSEVFATHPVMLRLGGEYYVRSVMQMLDDGSLKFACAIDEGLVLTMATGVDMIENLREKLDELHTKMNPRVIIGCECFFRKLEVLDRDIKDSISRIMAQHNVIGFHTYGEQINAVHVNQTFTGVAIGAE